MAKTVPFTQARSELTQLLDEVALKHEHLVITRRGEPAAVMISPLEYEALQETIEVLQDTEALRALDRAEEDVAKGDLTSWDEVRRDLGLV